MTRPAVFLDRDGTIIEAVHYISRPDDVRLIPGAAAAIRSLRTAGFACVVVTNQSAIGRGIITEVDYRAVRERLDEALRIEGTELDASYHCPVVPKVAGRDTIEDHDRKPGPGMLERAARELDLDLRRSWMVGDMISDLLAGAHAGCRGVIGVETGPERPDLACLPHSIEARICSHIAAAADWIVGRATRGTSVIS